MGLSTSLSLLGGWIVGQTDIAPYGNLSFFIQLPFRLAGICCFALGAFLALEALKANS